MMRLVLGKGQIPDKQIAQEQEVQMVIRDIRE
jgi:hypothetical protein